MSNRTIQSQSICNGLSLLKHFVGKPVNQFVISFPDVINADSDNVRELILEDCFRFLIISFGEIMSVEHFEVEELSYRRLLIDLLDTGVQLCKKSNLRKRNELYASSSAIENSAEKGRTRLTPPSSPV